MTYNKPGDYTPADFLKTNGNLVISGCCDSCPYATLAPDQGDISNDTSEAEYLCGLMDGKKMWGENPECSLTEWLKVATFAPEAGTGRRHTLTREEAQARFGLEAKPCRFHVNDGMPCPRCGKTGPSSNQANRASSYKMPPCGCERCGKEGEDCNECPDCSSSTEAGVKRGD